MPTFTTPAGRDYEIDGKYLVWQTEDWDDEPSVTLRFPLRIKNNIMEEFSKSDDQDLEAVLGMMRRLFPALADAIGELDTFETAQIFYAFQKHYNELNGGASLGEALTPPVSSPPTEEPSNTTGENDSAPAQTT